LSESTLVLSSEKQMTHDLRMWSALIIIKLFRTQGIIRTWRTMTHRRVAGFLWDNEQTMMTEGDGDLWLYPNMTLS
jgi:hypothetical protein